MASGATRKLDARPYEHIHAIGSADFLDDLISHPQVAKAKSAAA
jgi:hypothetical protein